MSDVFYLSIDELGSAYRARSLSPIEVVAATLARIERLDTTLRSYVTLCGDAALSAARDSEARFGSGTPRGALDGIPIGLKDLYDTAGVRTTGNSRLFAERIPDTDAEVVRLLKAAGAVIVGKHAMTELAAGAMSEQDTVFPPARNPWDPERVPGLSSSGSVAAVAAGLCAAAMGSDTAGSIRGPAHLCGVVGLKPTYDRISRRGMARLAPSLDHAGPIARTVAGVRHMFHATRRDRVRETTPRRLDLLGVRIWAPLATVEATDGLHPDMRSAYHAALATLTALGASVDTTGRLPELAYAGIVALTITRAEALSIYGAIAASRPDVFGRAFYGKLLEGALLSAGDHVDALRGRGRVARGIAKGMRGADLIALPTALRSAPRAVEEASGSQGVFLQAFDVTGQPAITVPCGMSEGLPLGLQLVGRPFADDLVLDAAEAFERGTPWHTHHPALEQVA